MHAAFYDYILVLRVSNDVQAVLYHYHKQYLSPLMSTSPSPSPSHTRMHDLFLSTGGGGKRAHRNKNNEHG